MKQIEERSFIQIHIWFVVSIILLVDIGIIQATSPELLQTGRRPLGSQALHKGMFLVASPHLEDPNFKETVVLICEYGPGGTIGLVINRQTAVSLSQVFPDISALEGKPDTLFAGGPVQPRGLLMLFRHEVGLVNTKEVLEGVHWGSNRDIVASMVAEPKSQERFRIYAGYAGWSSGQLEVEMANGGWTTRPADPESIFDKDPVTLWSELGNIHETPRQFISYPPP